MVYLSESDNPLVRKHLAKNLVGFFMKSNLKNYFDKFFEIVKKMSEDSNTLVQCYVIDTLSSIMSKNSNQVG